jgi:hypothetical protein
MPEPKLIEALPPHRCSAGEQIRNESHLWPLDGSLLAIESHPKGTMDDAKVIELILELKVVVDCKPYLSVQRVEDFQSSWGGARKVPLINVYPPVFNRAAEDPLLVVIVAGLW